MLNREREITHEKALLELEQAKAASEQRLRDEIQNLRSDYGRLKVRHLHTFSH